MSLRSFLIYIGEVGSPLSWAVTAFDPDDALKLVAAHFPVNDPNADLNILELTPEEIQQRVPGSKFGVPLVRGIWYPHFDNP